MRRAVAPVSGRCRTGRQRIYILTLPTRRAGHMLCRVRSFFFFLLVFTGLTTTTTTTYKVFVVRSSCFSIRQGNPRVWFSCIFGYPVVSRACIYLLFTFFLVSAMARRTFENCVVVARSLLLLLVFLLSALYSHFLEKYKKKKKIKTKCNEAVPLAQSFVCSRSNSKWQIVSLFVLI